MKKYKFAIIIALILFFVPFFWLSPGEMNIGGDSGRLFFYDPGAYLNLHVFYNYLQSGFGKESTYCILFPYVVFLFLLKLIFKSPTILIDILNGLTLSIGFFSAYLILKELIKFKENAVKLWIVETSSILGGLFYILSQMSIYSGWEKPITSFNQVFLNPFMAFLLLKLMLTQKIKYLVLILFTTFIFTSNFSIAGAPPFFAFYPITVIFLFSYAKFVRKITFKWKIFAIGIALFLLIHSFQLANTVGGIFTSGSPYNQTVFAQEGAAESRNGLSYFIAVKNSVKINLIWMSLGQEQVERYLAIFIIMPLALIISFFLNRGKTLLLTGLFFLVSFYFASAVTDTGFFIYKQFFKVPGFSMFRNFYGQWAYVLYFFYALLLGQALAIVASKLSKRLALIFLIVFSAIIVGFGWPLLSGSVPMATYGDKLVRSAFRMDPLFEQVLQYFRSIPVDGKVLMFPLTDPGYQILQGKDGGFYKGLPMISYLGDKSEFGGFATLSSFKDVFVTAMKNNNHETLKKLFAVMNIKWIFYNSYPGIFSERFKPTYGYISKYAPKDQEGYKKFIEKLPITKLVDFGKMFHIYSVSNDVYIPHIFITENATFTNDAIQLMFASNFQKDAHQAVIPIENAKSKKDPMILYGLPKSFLAGITDNSHLFRHGPYVDRKLDNLFYPLTIIKERFDLGRSKNNPSQYLNYAFFYLSKRIEELRSFGEKMDIGQESWQEPFLWDINKWFSYNNWSASFVRYEKAVDEIIGWVDKAQISDEDRMFDKLRINEQLYRHEITLLRAIYDLNKTSSDKKYLLVAVDNMYKKLYEEVNLPIIDLSLHTYSLPPYANREGSYELYLQGKNILDQNQNQISIRLGDQRLKTPAKTISIDNKSRIEAGITMPILNLASGQKWENSGVPVGEADGTTTMVINNKLGSLTNGLTLEIPNWEPGRTYLISFDYNTNGDDFVFSSVDRVTLNDSVKKTDYRLFLEKRLNSNNFKTSQSVAYAEADSSAGFLRIVPFSPKTTSTIRIKNLIIQKVDYPSLVFKKVVPEDNVNQLPHLTFTKINPTRYVVDIKGAESPYMLVFLEAFNGNWKLFDPEKNSNSLRGEIGRLAGQIGKFSVGLFVKDKTRENVIVATYDSGQVKEGASMNVFLDSKTFDTWGKNTVSDRTHTLVDGYANAWYIEPSDVNGKTDYTLILELKTQKQFYPLVLLSLLTVASLLLYSIRKLLWPKKR